MTMMLYMMIIDNIIWLFAASDENSVLQWLIKNELGYILEK